MSNEGDGQEVASAASLTLRELYNRVLALREELQCKYSEELYEKCINKLRECHRDIMALSLFSWNETAEDLSTLSMQYFPVEYYLGVTLTMRQTTDAVVRLTVLEEAREWLGLFLKRVHSYEGLLTGEIRALIEPIRDSGSSSSREIKIARHRKLSLSRQVPKGALANHGADDDLIREMATRQIQAHCIEAQIEMESIEEEIKLLKGSETDVRMGPSSPPPKSIDSSATSRGPSVTKLSRPFILLNNRQQLRDRVFKPGHNLPTMTIDEYLALERAKGGILAPETMSPHQKEDEDCEETVDGRTMRDRQFDLFKDENPRGWGNTHNLG